jgi:PAS domain S-box-containing protein
MSSFGELEERNSRENVERVESALAREISALDTFLHDWSAWDDTYDFVEDRNDAYVEANLLNDTFINAQLNLMVFVNSSGDFVFAEAFDLQNETEIQFPQGFTQSLSINDTLWRFAEAEGHVDGIVVLQEGPMLIASRPITTSRGEGPIRGALIMGRNLDSEEIGRLSEREHLPLIVQRFDAPQLPPDFQEARSSLSDQKPILVRPLNPDLVAGYALLKDIYGNPSLVLRVDLPRDIFKQGMATTSFLMFAILGVGLVFCVVFVLGLERMVLSRLAQLSTAFKNIGRSGDLSMRVQVKGKDELSELSGEINRTLSALEDSRLELRRYSEHLKELVEEKTEDLRKSEEKIRSIFVASPDAIIATDLNGNIVECNERTLKLHGYSSKEELVGKSSLELIAEKDHQKAVENIKRTLEQGSMRNAEYTFVAKDRREFPAEISASVVHDASGNPRGFVAVFKDISERKKMEQLLFESERFAAIGQLAGMIGHDLRNPLTGIAGAAYYLKKRLGPKMDQKAIEMLELIEKGIENSNKIINDLLEYSREMKLELTQTNLKSILKEALGFIEIPKNVQILDETDSELKMKVDAERMLRVFTNIIKNAVDAMPKGGKLRVTSWKSNNDYRIEFSDTGIGITKCMRDKIWSPLFTTKAKGMGFGLPICKRMVEAHGGKISLEGEIAKGTTVTITLPLEPKPREGETLVNLPEPLLPETTKTRP